MIRVKFTTEVKIHTTFLSPEQEDMLRHIALHLSATAQQSVRLLFVGRPLAARPMVTAQTKLKVKKHEAK